MLITLRRKLAEVAWIEFRPVFERLQGWQILGPFRIVKLRATQPTAREAIPEQDGVHLPGELIDSPEAGILDDLAGRIERQAVELAQRVDLICIMNSGIRAIAFPIRRASSDESLLTPKL